MIGPGDIGKMVRVGDLPIGAVVMLPPHGTFTLDDGDFTPGVLRNARNVSGNRCGVSRRCEWMLISLPAAAPPIDPLRVIGPGAPVLPTCGPACDPVAPVVALVPAVPETCRGRACIAETFALRCRVDALTERAESAERIAAEGAAVVAEQLALIASLRAAQTRDALEIERLEAAAATAMPLTIPCPSCAQPMSSLLSSIDCPACGLRRKVAKLEAELPVLTSCNACSYRDAETRDGPDLCCHLEIGGRPIGIDCLEVPPPAWCPLRDRDTR